MFDDSSGRPARPWRRWYWTAFALFIFACFCWITCFWGGPFSWAQTGWVLFFAAVVNAAVGFAVWDDDGRR